MWTKIISKFLYSENQRSGKIKKNILISLGLKGTSILISLILIPITINYLNPTEYGVWLTLLSILSWISFFDIGLGNGLRNKLAEAFAKEDQFLAKVYVSTTFAILSLIMTICFLFFVGFNSFLNWSAILNIDQQLGSQLSSIIVFIFAFSCIQFILKLTGVVPIADQRPAINDLINTAGNVVSLLCIYILTLTTQGSLFKAAFVFTGVPVIIFLVAYFILFNKEYKSIRPSFKYINFTYARDLFGLGVQFFIIQIACMVIFTSANLIITQLFGPEQVTPYNIAFKYFSVITMLVGIIMTPMWSAITDAYTRNDLKWIRAQMRSLIKLWGAVVVCVVLMLILAQPVYHFWIGNTVNIPYRLSLFMGLYVIISSWNNIYAFFINGVGKIRIQMYCSILSCTCFFPLTYWLTPRMGVDGVILTMCIVLLLSTAILPMQYHKIITRTASGIWNK